MLDLAPATVEGNSYEQLHMDLKGVDKPPRNVQPMGPEPAPEDKSGEKRDSHVVLPTRPSPTTG